MFENFTYEALLNDILANAPDGIDIRQGSIYYDAVSGAAIQIAKLYTDIDQVFQYVFITTASGEYLDLKAGEYGLGRQEASSAEYLLVYEGTAPKAGDRFFHNNSGEYFTLGVENDNFLLISEEKGTNCNEIPEGDLAVPVNTISGLEVSKFGALYKSGIDTESDESLRRRLQEKIAGPAENGNRQHYKTWCESVDGVGLARIMPLWNGPNTVKAVLIDPDGQPCSAAVAAEVQEYVDPAEKGYTAEVGGKTYTVGDGLGEGVANLGAHFTAVPADSVEISVEFRAVLADGKTKEDAAEEVQAALEEYFKEIAMDTDGIVRFTRIGAIIVETESILDYSNLQVNGGTENIFPSDDGVPVFSGVLIDVNV